VEVKGCLCYKIGLRGFNINNAKDSIRTSCFKAIRRNACFVSRGCETDETSETRFQIK